MKSLIMNGGRRARPCGFSLIELLTVIAILAVLMVFALPAVNSIGGASALTRQGQALNDQFLLARQLAASRNREVELRLLFETGGSGGTNWASQLWEIKPGISTNSASRKIRFPDNLLINPGLSPILTGMTPVSQGGEKWYAFRFRSNGRLAGQLSGTNNYLTIQLRTDSPGSPRNYFTLQINPITGLVSTYRP
ncbi:MAG TPA: Verru_Chthon cassette protein D [Terrimicrobiaceae bacterium]|nr:Verru_Chthon cassette protein D [Terrimicrobiaceae bacterium]